MAKNFNLQDDEKFCIFATKDKGQALNSVLTMSYLNNVLHRVFTGFWQQKRFGISYS